MSDTEERARFDAWWRGDYGPYGIRAEWPNSQTEAAWMAWKAQAEEIERLQSEVKRLEALLNKIPLMVEKWDTFYIDNDDKIHHSGIGKTIAHDIRSMLHSNGGIK